MAFFKFSFCLWEKERERASMRMVLGPQNNELKVLLKIVKILYGLSRICPLSESGSLGRSDPGFQTGLQFPGPMSGETISVKDVTYRGRQEGRGRNQLRISASFLQVLPLGIPRHSRLAAARAGLWRGKATAAASAPSASATTSRSYAPAASITGLGVLFPFWLIPMFSLHLSAGGIVKLCFIFSPKFGFTRLNEYGAALKVSKSMRDSLYARLNAVLIAKVPFKFF